MRQRIRSHLTYANVTATLALFLVLGGGVAYAANTVFSSDIVNNQVYSADVRDDTLTGGGLVSADILAGAVRSSEVRNDNLRGGDVLNDSLTGADVAEPTLGQVPSATLGGLGGLADLGSPCDPESTSFTTCASGGTNLPGPSRVLIIGQIRAEPDTGGGDGGGSCAVASDVGAHASVPVFVNGGQTDVIAISAVTPPVGPGPVMLSIRCNETASGIRYFDGRVNFVALSPG